MPMNPNEPANPYQAPATRVVAEHASLGESEVIPGGKVPAMGAAGSWLSRSWSLFASAPGAWILTAIVGFLIVCIASAIPFAGSILGPIAAMLLNGGVYLGCRAHDEGKPYSFDYLFAAFNQGATPLVIAGAIYGALKMLGSYLIFSATLGSTISLLELRDSDSVMRLAAEHGWLALASASAGVILYGLVLSGFFFFAPVLIAVYRCTVGDALRWSFSGCIKGMIPLFILSLIAAVLFMCTVFTLGLGLLVVGPLWYISLYYAARDIFEK